MHLDRRLTWQHHIFTKRKQLGLKYSKLLWLLGNQSKLSMDNKLAIYKVILKPVWIYGAHLWGTASVSNIEASNIEPLQVRPGMRLMKRCTEI